MTADWNLPTDGTSFCVPWHALDKARAQFNQMWAVVSVSAKTRYVRTGYDGQPEFFDKSNFLNMFEASTFETTGGWNKEDATPKIVKRKWAPDWLEWEGRQQYRGYGFYPNGKAPEGVYNLWQGFSVEPKRGEWGLLRDHIRDNICRGNEQYDDWFMSWLAQLVQEPHKKPGTHVVLIGKEGVGKSKLGEWLKRVLGICGTVLTNRERVVGRFNGHFETLVFALCEEVFWAGDKMAEGVIKALATANEMDYERKGLDPTTGKNYLRMMIASNSDWVVPAWSGGRRWFVLQVGDNHERDSAYFAAIDKQMENGGLEAMLFDLLRHPITENLRNPPITPWLVEQRIHSLDRKQEWLRGVIERGGFDYNDAPNLELDLNEYYQTEVDRKGVTLSAAPYFSRPGSPAQSISVAKWLEKELDSLFNTNGKRLTVRNEKGEKERPRSWVFAPLQDLRKFWLEKYGEDLSPPSPKRDERVDSKNITQFNGKSNESIESIFRLESVTEGDCYKRN